MQQQVVPRFGLLVHSEIVSRTTHQATISDGYVKYDGYH